MKHDHDKHHRRSIRLKGYDYSKAGTYFVTICTQNRECLFGDIFDGEICLNDAGCMIQKWWYEAAGKFKNIVLDEFMIMPNHFHGIIAIVGATLCGCPGIHDRPEINLEPANTEQPHRVAPTLGDIIDWFKTMTTNEYIRNVRQKNWPTFNGKFWQRNYYEHVVRGEKELHRIRKYIIDNPAKWAEDEDNPAHINRRGLINQTLTNTIL
jgi:REP element-mobilizing transposase RayT